MQLNAIVRVGGRVTGKRWGRFKALQRPPAGSALPPTTPANWTPPTAFLRTLWDEGIGGRPDPARGARAVQVIAILNGPPTFIAYASQQQHRRSRQRYRRTDPPQGDASYPKPAEP